MLNSRKEEASSKSLNIRAYLSLLSFSGLSWSCLHQIGLRNQTTWDVLQGNVYMGLIRAPACWEEVVNIIIVIAAIGQYWSNHQGFDFSFFVNFFYFWLQTHAEPHSLPPRPILQKPHFLLHHLLAGLSLSPYVQKVFLFGSFTFASLHHLNLLKLDHLKHESATQMILILKSNDVGQALPLEHWNIYLSETLTIHLPARSWSTESVSGWNSQSVGEMSTESNCNTIRKSREWMQ